MQFSSTDFGVSVEPDWSLRDNFGSCVWMNVRRRRFIQYVKELCKAEAIWSVLNAAAEINVSVQLSVFSAQVSSTGSVMSGSACAPLCIYTFTRTHVCHCGLSVSWDEFAFTAFCVTPAAAAVPWGQRSELQKIMSWQIERRQTDGPVTVGFAV